MYQAILFLIAFNYVQDASGAKRPAQHKERIILQRVEILEQNRKYLHAAARVNKINHTEYALSANYTILNTFPPATLKINGFALYSNEYKKMPVSITRNLCDVFNNELKWVENDLKASTYPKNCPITKGEFYIRNYIPSNTNLPFVCPWEDIKVRFYLIETNNKKTILLVDLFIKIDKTARLVKE